MISWQSHRITAAAIPIETVSVLRHDWDYTFLMLFQHHNQHSLNRTCHIFVAVLKSYVNVGFERSIWRFSYVLIQIVLVLRAWNSCPEAFQMWPLSEPTFLEKDFCLIVSDVSLVIIAYLIILLCILLFLECIFVQSCVTQWMFSRTFV